MKCILSCVLALVLQVEAQRTVTLTESRTITSTVHFSTNFACAKLVNVTGRCRQRRGFPVEEPIILMIDEPFHHEPNWFNHHRPLLQFIPSKILRVEATPLAIFSDWAIDHPVAFHPVTVESSMQKPSGRNNNRQQQSQGFFPKFFSAFFNTIVSTINVTVTNVFTQTLSRTTTNTISFVIMSCTPSPLRYTVCPTSETVSAPSDNEDEERKFLFKVWKKHKWKPFFQHSIETRTSTITSLVISSTVGLCAQLVNVTGPCRLRRGLWIDDPIVLSFDDDMESIDETFSPSRTLRIEPTAMPEFIADERGTLSGRSLSNSKIQPSTMDSMEETDEELSQRHGFINFAAFHSALWKKTKFKTLKATTVVTVIITSTYYVTYSTNTFFVQVCTPTPFPYSVCSRRSS